MQPIPTVCPNCKKTKFAKHGVGTQQMVKIIEKIFPSARVARADMDATVNKKNWQKTVTDFYNGDLDILVGTQTITKGYHFPNVTLVGIIWADVSIHFPTYNASESTLQQLIQVAGRAGRERPDSRVILQTMGAHHIFSFINEIDYRKFYDYEIAQREQLAYPPCGRFAEIELVNKNESAVERDAQTIAREILKNKPHELMVLGPTPPPVAKIKNTHRRKIYLKAPTFQSIHESLNTIKKLTLSSSWHFNPNPL